MTNTKRTYVKAFKQWMTEWKPHAFVTINLPHVRRAPREETYYLSRWTRAAEGDVLGQHTVKEITDFNRRIVWLCRREVSPDGMIHYHAIVKFPVNRPWRDEFAYAEKKGTTTDVSFRRRMSEHGFANVVRRCAVLKTALQRASCRTPEPFTPLSVADIDVRPFDAERNHAGYLLKGLRDFPLPANREFTSDDLLRDSGLIVLPHLPKKKSAAR